MGAGSKCDPGLIMPNTVKRREPSSNGAGSDDQKDPRDPRGGNDAGPKEFKGGVPAPVKPVETLRLRSGVICSNIGTKALLEEEKRKSKRMEAIGICFPSQHIDAHRHRLAALEAPIALVLKSYRETDLVGERLDVIRIMTISAVWAERVSATYEPPGPFI